MLAIVTIHWKGVEQYFTVELFVNPLTPRVKPWVIQSFLTLILWTEPKRVTIHWKAVEQYFTVELFVFSNFTQLVILETFSIELDTVRSERVIFSPA